jgi:hypothetical protein
VLSHWRDGVCVASTPVEVDDLPELIALLADALGDAARRSESSAVVSGTARPGVLAKLKLWLRPHLAQMSNSDRPSSTRASARTRTETDRIRPAVLPS